MALQGFTHWFAGVQRDEAQVLKQQRLMKEDQAHMSKSGGAPSGSDLGAGAADEKKARKAAAKAAKARGGAAAGRPQ